MNNKQCHGNLKPLDRLLLFVALLKSATVLVLRSFGRQKTFYLINTMGLSIGLTAFITIVTYVRYEFGFDKFHTNSENIYRINTSVSMQGDVINRESNTFQGVIEALRNDTQNVSELTVISGFDSDGTFLRTSNNNQERVSLVEFKGLYVDASFFNVFSFPLERGDRESALRNAYTAIVSETVASQYFMNQAIGKVLEFTDGDGYAKRLTITAVMKDVPPDSHLRFDILVHIPEPELTFWDWTGHPYMLLHPNANTRQIEERLNLLMSHTRNDSNDYGRKHTLTLQRLDEIHLFSNLDYEFEPGGLGILVYALMLIAILILAAAWINYINLSIALSIEKIRQIGIRKIFGATKNMLIMQVLAESTFINALALAIALGLTWILHAAGSELLPVQLPDTMFYNPELWTGCILLLIVSTLGSGGYPALIIASCNPLDVLKAQRAGEPRLVTLTKILVVFQFAVASLLLIFSTISHEQLHYMQNHESGLDMDDVLIIKALNFDKEAWSQDVGGYALDSGWQQKAELFKNDLQGLTSVMHVSSLSHLPGEMPEWGTEFKSTSSGMTGTYSLRAVGVDYDFIQTLGATLLAGRGFSLDYPTDRGNEKRRAILINEVSSKLLGFKRPEDAVSSRIMSDWGADYEIVGVINSFHQRSLKEDLTPLYFILKPRALAYFAIKLKNVDPAVPLENVTQLWRRHFPDVPFHSFYLNDFFFRQYRDDQNLNKTISLFTSLSIFIGCIGLLGMTSYAVVQRTREIGIRKVLGASLSNLIVLFSKEILKLNLLSAFLVIPLAYVAITWWLATFAFKVELTCWMLLAPVLIVASIGLITVSTMAMRASLQDPVKSLRGE